MKGKGKGLLLALGMPKSKGSESEAEESVDMASESKRSAAQDLISAVKSGDADAVASAFSALYDACATHSSDDSEDEDEDDY